MTKRVKKWHDGDVIDQSGVLREDLGVHKLGVSGDHDID
jgi:hypothetical protein